MPLDLNDAPTPVDSEDAGRVIVLKDLNGEEWADDEGNPITATIVGTYSKRYQKAKTHNIDRAIKARGKATGGDVEDAALRLDAALVLAWDIVSGGKMADPVTVFQRLPHVREQITEEANAHASFSKPVSNRP